VALVDQSVLAVDVARVGGVGEHRGLAEYDIGVFRRGRQQERIVIERRGKDQASTTGD
jgi:hypothetical protein